MLKVAVNIVRMESVGQLKHESPIVV